jgi:organic radical activating enzyme
MKDGLKVAETFISIQGEGPTAGQRAVFLRLSGCALDCTFCDTTEVWKQGVFYKFEELISHLEEIGALNVLNKGARLILTGGDPLLQIKELHEFLVMLFFKLEKAIDVEVETEGVLLAVGTELDDYVTQYNVSPKLANSGMPFVRRVRPAVIESHVKAHSKEAPHIFKFVVASMNDVAEMVQTYVEPFNIPRDRVWLMPMCSSREAQDALAHHVVQLAIDHGFNYSPRLHLQIWNRKTGV